MLSDYQYLRKWLAQANVLIHSGSGSSLARLNEKKQLVAGKNSGNGLLNKVTAMTCTAEREKIKSICIDAARQADQFGQYMGLKSQFTETFTGFNWQSCTIERLASLIQSLVNSAHGQAVEAAIALNKSVNTGFSRHCNELSGLTDSNWFSMLLDQLQSSWTQFHKINQSEKDLGCFKSLLVETAHDTIQFRQESDEAPDNALIDCVSEAINLAITEFVNRNQKKRKDIEWVVYPINSFMADQEIPMATAEAYGKTPKALKSISSKQLLESGLVTSKSEYQALSEDLGRIYMEWPGIMPRLQAFRKLQIFNPGLDNSDFTILMRRWSYDEQERWHKIVNNTSFDNNDAALPILAEIFRQTIHTLGRNGHLHPRVLNAIQFIDLKSLSTANIISQLQAFSTICYGLGGNCLAAEAMADIINQSPMEQEVIQKILNAWHDPEALEELADALAEG